MKYVVLFLTDLLDPKAPDFEYTKLRKNIFQLA